MGQRVMVANESEELSTDEPPAVSDGSVGGSEETIHGSGNDKPHSEDPALNNFELERLLSTALDAEDKRLWRQTINVGLTRSDLEAHLRSRIGELASVRVREPEVETENFQKAVQALQEFQNRRTDRARHWWTRTTLRRARAKRELEELEASVDAAKRTLDEATEAARFDSQLENAKGAIRDFINKNDEGRYEAILDVVDYEGLAETDDPRYAVSTTARQRLEWLLKNLRGGSIGLAGPRGAGKSTLIRIACPEDESPGTTELSGGQGTDGEKPPFAVIVSAPVQFEPREFVLHLFAEICRKILGRPQVEALRQPGLVSRRLDPIIPRLLAAAAPLTMLAGGVLIFLSLAPRAWHLKSGIVWGGLVILASAAILLLSRQYYVRYRYERYQAEDRYEGSYGSPDDTPEMLARRRLVDIWFQQTFTSGWSGALKIPIGVEAEIENSRDLAKEQMSLPDVVSELRYLVRKIADTRQVRIGIDELDKIESPEAAWRFMNEIKVLFMIPDCFFLVSVSEEAMTAFQRRGLPFRDVFDSSFDDVVDVGYLSTAAAVELIQRRIVGIRVPFILLCHCMSGGLARDLIRAARDVVTLNSHDPTGGDLSEIARLMVTDDIAIKANAAMFACGRLRGGPGVELVLNWLEEAVRERWTAPALLDWLRRSDSKLKSLTLWRISNLGGEAGTVAAVALAKEFAAFSLFSATLLELFVTERPTEFWAATAPKAGPCPIDELVRARQAFTIDPCLAWKGIVRFRKNVKGFSDAPSFPKLAPIGSGRGPRLSALGVGLLDRLSAGAHHDGRAD